ncbi:glutaredoxin family protein [Lentibacillus salinarum]|uniref:Glutaredoxin family protein n=1 Tax=Lentibacillus salinarum TaxID=446820 RepID=A0ABW3ZW63_9BACI
MSEQEVIVYISENSSHCHNLVNKLYESDIDYKTKNVTEYPEYLEQLHEWGIFGTPATFVNDQAILGNQLNKIKSKLGMLDRYQSYRFFDKKERY